MTGNNVFGKLVPHTTIVEYREPSSFPHQLFNSFPNTLKRLSLRHMTIVHAGSTDLDLMKLLPNLEALTVDEADCDWFEHIPRSVTDLDIDKLRTQASPMFSDGKMLQHLPPSLRTLRLAGDISLPLQDWSYLPHLQYLDLSFASDVPSSKLRTLPRSLKQLWAKVNVLDDDVVHLPQHLEDFTPVEWTTPLAMCLPLKCLAHVQDDFSKEFERLAQTRVRQAAVHQ